MAPVQFQDYYATLGLSRDADQKEIKRAFRKKAREHHPDLNRDNPEAESRFKELNEAHEVLSDPEKRSMYDRYGSDWERYKDAGFDAASGPGPSSHSREPGDFEQWFTGTSGGPSPTDGATFGSSSSGGSGGFSDFFNLLFGQAGGRTSGFQQRIAPVRGEDLEVDVSLSLDEAMSSTLRRLTVRAPKLCDLCDGAGVVRGAMCPRCDGSGQLIEPRTLEIKVPAGVSTGSRVRIRGQGGPGQHGGASGDVYLRIQVQPNNSFERSGDNIKTTVKVPLYTAVLGGEVQVPTMNGRVMLTIPPETQSGRTFRLRGKGMPRIGSPGTTGDLLVRAEIEIPTELSEEERDLFSQLKNLRQ